MEFLIRATQFLDGRNRNFKYEYLDVDKYLLTNAYPMLSKFNMRDVDFGINVEKYGEAMPDWTRGVIIEIGTLQELIDLKDCIERDVIIGNAHHRLRYVELDGDDEERLINELPKYEIEIYDDYRD